MTWKPKEKDLTLEEAVAMAKKEFAPFWIGSSPLIVGVKSGERHSVFPLDQTFAKSPWLILIVDPTDYSGQTGLLYAQEWHQRYESLGLRTLMVFSAPYQFLKRPRYFQKLADDLKLEFPLTVDIEGTLAPAFGTKVSPKVLLHSKSKNYFHDSGKDWLAKAEQSVQNFLRSTDPGLPLLPIFEPEEKQGQSVGRLEFGLKWDKPLLQGNWQWEEERVVTSDPEAAVILNSPSTRISIIAESLSQSMDPSLIAVEPNDRPAYDAIAGEHLIMEESGSSSIRVLRAQLYHALIQLPEKERKVTLRFTNANVAPIALYGVRFGN